MVYNVAVTLQYADIRGRGATMRESVLCWPGAGELGAGRSLKVGRALDTSACICWLLLQ